MIGGRSLPGAHLSPPRPAGRPPPIREPGPARLPPARRPLRANPEPAARGRRTARSGRAGRDPSAAVRDGGGPGRRPARSGDGRPGSAPARRSSGRRCWCGSTTCRSSATSSRAERVDQALLELRDGLEEAGGVLPALLHGRVLGLAEALRLALEEAGGRGAPAFSEERGGVMAAPGGQREREVGQVPGQPLGRRAPQVRGQQAEGAGPAVLVRAPRDRRPGWSAPRRGCARSSPPAPDDAPGGRPERIVYGTWA